MREYMNMDKETVVRPWGHFTNLARGEGFLVKIIHVNPGQRLSVQSHNYRSEHWYAVKGNPTVQLGDETFVLNENESIDIPVKAVHSLQNPSDKAIEIIEIQRGNTISEDDIIRYKDIYGRA